MRKNLYVNDSLNSLDDEEEAVALRKELTELMKHGGFTLTKWLSNSQTVMKEIPESDKVPTKEVKLGDLPTSQALGVHYNAQTDSLHLSSPKKPPAKTPRGDPKSHCLSLGPTWMAKPVHNSRTSTSAATLFGGSRMGYRDSRGPAQ